MYSIIYIIVKTKTQEREISIDIENLRSKIACGDMIIYYIIVMYEIK